jgi:hypothetical protein
MPPSTEQIVPKQTRAATPADAFWTFDPLALVRPGDPWYCNLDDYFDRHHYGFANDLKRRLTPPDARFMHVGVVGHRGTGKTTQVRRVTSELRAGTVSVFVDAIATLDQADFTFSDLLLVVVESVVARLKEAKVDIPQEEAELVRLWFAEELLTEEHRNSIIGTVETEASAKGGLPWIASLAAKLTAQLRSDNVYRQEIRRRAERDPNDLLRKVNRLLDAATKALNAERLLVVVDNLEKIDNRNLVDAAVLRRAEDLRRLRCDLVLFFAPSDQYAPISVAVRDAFETVTIPVFPVRDRNHPADHVSQEAHRAVRQLLALRSDLTSVFAEVDDTVKLIACLSGGRVRDVSTSPGLPVKSPTRTRSVLLTCRWSRGV